MLNKLKVVTGMYSSVCCQLRPLYMSKQHWGGVSLETCDSLGLFGLFNHVDSLTHPDTDRQSYKLLVEGYQHTRLHGGGQPVRG